MIRCFTYSNKHKRWRLKKMEVIEMNILSVGKFPIKIKDIIYIETSGRNLLVHTRDHKYTCSGSIKGMLEILKSEGFYKSHQSYLVNLDEVESFDNKDIYMKNHEKVMLSKRQRRSFKENYFQYWLQKTGK